MIPCEECLVYVICNNATGNAIQCSILFESLMQGQLIDKIELASKLFKKRKGVNTGALIIYRDIMRDDHIIYVEPITGKRNMDISTRDRDDIPNLLKVRNEGEGRHFDVFNVSTNGIYMIW